MIIKDKSKLNKKCEEVTDFKEAENGIGLAANQIGINKRVCVVNVTEPLYFINPRIVDLQDDILYNEGCLSFLPIFLPSLLIVVPTTFLSNIVIPSRWSISC